MAGEPGEDLFDAVNMRGDFQPQDAAEHGAHDAKQETVAQENLHDAAVGGAQRLEDADIACLLDDDHGEDRQDAEAGDADNQEQQNIQDALFNGDGCQQRALLVFPGLHTVVQVLGQHRAQRRDHLLVIVIVLELDLQAGRPVLHGAQLLQPVERDEDVTGVVLAHFGLDEICDHNAVEDGIEPLPADRVQKHFIAALQKRDHFRLVGVGTANPNVADGVPNNYAGLRFLLLPRHIGRRQRSGGTLHLLERCILQRRPVLIVPAFRLGRELEARVLLVPRVRQKFGEAAHAGPRLGVGADDVHRARLQLLAFVADRQQAENLDHRGHGLDLVPNGGVQDTLHLLFGIVEAVEVIGIQAYVGNEAMQALLQLGAEAAHNAIDDNQRGHAEHHADDAGHGQTAREQIAPAQQQFVHRP